MKALQYTTALLITLLIILTGIRSQERDRKINSNIATLSSRITSIESQLQTIQDNYISYDDLQPVLDEFVEYQEEVDEIRNNLNDFNGLWDQLFNYEQEQYVMRGR